MPRERLVRSYLVRFTEDEVGPRVRVQDLGAGVTLEFETWVAAWAYVDRVVNGCGVGAADTVGDG